MNATEIGYGLIAATINCSPLKAIFFTLSTLYELFCFSLNFFFYFYLLGPRVVYKATRYDQINAIVRQTFEEVTHVIVSRSHYH